MLQAVRLLTELARTSEDHNIRGSNAMSSVVQPLGSEASVLFREIHKNGWLRRTDVKVDKDFARFWVTFCVHDDAEPRLEGYSNEKQAATHSPVWFQSLRSALYLSPTLCATSKNEYEFCINFNEERLLRLAAPSYQSMLDWVQIITRKLTDMKILRAKENVYSRGPERIATRDPTSPLPPPPGLNRPIPSTSSAPANIFSFDDTNANERRLQGSSTSFRAGSGVPGTSSGQHNANENQGNISYESIFLAQSGETSREHSNRQQDDQVDQYAALMEFTSSDSPDLGNLGRQTCGMLLTLREQQVLQLRKEISHPAGVRLKLGRRECKDGIAFVDSFEGVWIAGWKQKEHPLLYNVLHIGDLVISIAGVPLHNAGVIKDILKNYSSPRVEMIVRRLPHARVMTLTRRSESEDFGLEVNGNEVVDIAESVRSLGFLPQFSSPVDPTADSISTVSWTLTEVNNKPLNLIDGNARDRLNTVGRDVSVVLQPSDLVSAIKKKLRSIRNYKNFILQ